MRSILLAISAIALVAGCAAADEPTKPVRIGMIGLDTSHCLAFAELLNKAEPGAEPGRR